MCLENPKQVKVNSIVLVRNIANEPKREPLKLAKIEKIHDSRDDTQRVVTLTYHNVRLNKDGEWIGTPVKVDRCINNLIMVDDALNESMLNPSILEKANTKLTSDENDGNDGARDDKNDEVDDNNEIDDARNDGTNEFNELRNDESDEIDQTDNVQSVRRSSRKHKQRIELNPDEIGDCDNENDPDYK